MDLSPLYRAVVEETADGIWVVDLEGRTVHGNRAAAAMAGVTVEDLATMSVFDVLDDVGREQFAEHLRDVAAGVEQQGDVETWLVDVHGHGSWVTVRETVLRGDDGAPRWLAYRLTDYDERRQVLAELEASREQLRETHRLAGMGSWQWVSDTSEVSSVPHGSLHEAEASTRPSAELVDLVHPDDLARAREAVQRAGRGEHPGTFEVEARVRLDDEWRWLRLRGKAVHDESGRPRGVVGTFLDVTAVRRAQEALAAEVAQHALFREITTAANDAGSVAEVLVRATQVVQRQPGWTASAFTVEGGSPRRIGGVGGVGGEGPSGDDVPPGHEELARAAGSPGAPARSSDGRTVAVPVGTSGRVHGVLVLSAGEEVGEEDLAALAATSGAALSRVAERDEARSSLAAARDDAMAAARERSEFLATVSHEIRTPLNGILGLSDLLRGTALDTRQQRLTDGLRTAGRALLHVINDVLDYGRMEQHGVDLVEDEMEPRQLLDEVSRTVHVQAREAGVELVVGCDPDVPASATTDRTRVAQVLGILLSNAVKFSPRGRVDARVSLDATTGSRSRLRFDVADTGVGVAPSDVPRLFAPFTQADSSTTRRFGGVGLGLAIARQVVTALGGEITYAPNPGGGSVFSFTVEVRDPSDAPGPLDEYAGRWLSGRRLLVVDADADRAAALGVWLHGWGMVTSGAADAEGALAALAASVAGGTPFDAVLIDLHLPGRDGLDGLDLAADIAAENAYDEVAMVVLSSTSDVDMDRVRAAGVSVCLERPVPVDQLRGTLLEQVAGVPARPIEPATRRGAPGAPRVLVVEDNPVNQVVATGLLESMGYRTDVADNGAEGLRMLAAGGYAAVLMDVQMPVLDGYAATSAIRAGEDDVTHLPVIAMTAAVVEGERERCLAAGMDDYLTKPVDPATLRATLQRWVPARTETPVPPSVPPSPEIPGLDTTRLDMLRDLDPGDTTYLDRAIGNFLVNSEAAVAAIGELSSAGDVAGLKAAAHKIAGSALNLGVSRAGEAARAVELLADSGTADGAEHLLPELDAALDEGRELLLRYQRSYGSDPGRRTPP